MAKPKVKPAPLPPAGAWFAAAPLNHARFDPSYGGPSGGLRLQVLALSDGRVLVRGGHVVNRARAIKHGGKHWLGSPVKECELWDGAAWRVIPTPMADELAKGGRISEVARKLPWHKTSNDDYDAERRGCALVDLGGDSVLIAGGAVVWSTWDGEDNEDPQHSTVLVTGNGKKLRWQFAGDVAQARMRGAGVRLADGRAMFVGGESANHDAFVSVDIWEPMTAERAVAAWARGKIAAALLENANYPASMGRELERISKRVVEWGAGYAPLFRDALRAELELVPPSKGATAAARFLG